VELTKEAGEPLSLALPNETYSVHVQNSGGEFVATVTLDHAGDYAFEEGALRRVSPEETVARGLSDDGVPSRSHHRNRHQRSHEARDDDDDDDDHHSAWYRRIPASFASGIRVERPDTPTSFDALVMLGG